MVNAMLCDTWVAAPRGMSLRGNVIHGFNGEHEIVLGGYSQVGIAPPRVGLMHDENGDARPLQFTSQRTGTAAMLALVQRRCQADQPVDWYSCEACPVQEKAPVAGCKGVCA